MFQFRDQAVDPYVAVDFIWRGNFQRIPSLPSQSIGLSIISHYMSTTLLETAIMGGFLQTISIARNSPYARSTTSEADEAVCLANIIGLDIKRLRPHYVFLTI